MWTAGGGVKRRQVLERADDSVLAMEDRPVRIRALQTTASLCLHIDRECLTCWHAGRDFRVTGVGSAVVREMLT